MARKRAGTRIYWRERGNSRRAYGDFRDYRDVGGGQEALIPSGSSAATTDPDVAALLVAQRVKDLESRRRKRLLLGAERQATLYDFAARHLEEKAKAGRTTETWLAQAERHLSAAVEFFGSERDVASIAVQDVQQFAHWLRERPARPPSNCRSCKSDQIELKGLESRCHECGASGRVKPLSGGTRRHYLNSLSNMYRRAAGEGYVQPGYNPVQALMEKPVARRTEARWLEVHEAALLLESARTYVSARPELALPNLYPLLATFLLTGGRKAEVLGLEVRDVSFDRRTITFRPNRWRRLKTATSQRTVPLWPQLEVILREYVFGSEGPPGTLLFPSGRLASESPIRDTRKALDAIGERCGWERGHIRTKMFRHTYCAARLQTLDRGAPVSAYTVAKELGHGGDSLVKRIYGHLGTRRHRSEVIEYEIEQHREVLGSRIAELAT